MMYSDHLWTQQTPSTLEAMQEPGGHTGPAFRARILEFRSFGLLAVIIFMISTGLAASSLVYALPVISLVGVGFALAACRIRERRPRLVAPILAMMHGAVIGVFVYVIVGTWAASP